MSEKRNKADKAQRQADQLEKKARHPAPKKTQAQRKDFSQAAVLIVKEIDRSRIVHVAALNAGDADAWVACFTDDGVQMPPHFGTNVGKTAIRGWSQGFLNLFRCRFSLSVDEVQVAADWAFERGRYTITLAPRAGGEPMNDSGKYITVYHRQSDGSWKIARDIWNSDQPLPGSPQPLER